MAAYEGPELSNLSGWRLRIAVAREFASGVSVEGIARKYHRYEAEIEELLQKVLGESLVGYRV